jgi:Secretion system C-terminal sorting domain
MKNLFFFVALIIVSTYNYGQDFAPIGTEWYYNEQFAFSGDINYIKFTSDKDTLIDDQICKKITKRHKIICNDRPNNEYIFSRNDTVFFFDEHFNEFQNLYLFNVNIGDSWIIKVKDEYQQTDSILIIVDSISKIEFNNTELKAIHVTYSKSNKTLTESHRSTIVERIGDLNYMFNWYPWSMIACDANYTTGLRCYQDSQIGLYSTGIVDSCDYTYELTSIDSKLQNHNIQIFPNPINDRVFIETTYDSNLEIEIRDLQCRILSSKCFNSKIEFDMRNYKSGLYLILIKNVKEILENKKIIKN